MTNSSLSSSSSSQQAEGNSVSEITNMESNSEVRLSRLHLVLSGETGSGKSTLLHKLIDDPFPYIDIPAGKVDSCVCIVNGSTMLHIADTPGLKPSPDMHLSEGYFNASIYVFTLDMTNPNFMQCIFNLMRNIEYIFENDDIGHVILVPTKSDLLSNDEIDSFRNTLTQHCAENKYLQQLNSQNRLTVHQPVTSLGEGTGIRELYMSITTLCKDMITKLANSSRGNMYFYFPKTAGHRTMPIPQEEVPVIGRNVNDASYPKIFEHLISLKKLGLALVGPINSGKSILSAQLRNEPFEAQYEPTTEAISHYPNARYGRNLRLQFLDTPGFKHATDLEEMTILNEHNYNIIFYCLDMTDPQQTLASIPLELLNNIASNAVIIVVPTKLDLAIMQAINTSVNLGKEAAKIKVLQEFNQKLQQQLESNSLLLELTTQEKLHVHQPVCAIESVDALLTVIATTGRKYSLGALKFQIDRASAERAQYEKSQAIARSMYYPEEAANKIYLSEESITSIKTGMLLGGAGLVAELTGVYILAPSFDMTLLLKLVIGLLAMIAIGAALGRGVMHYNKPKAQLHEVAVVKTPRYISSVVLSNDGVTDSLSPYRVPRAPIRVKTTQKVIERNRLFATDNSASSSSSSANESVASLGNPS